MKRNSNSSMKTFRCFALLASACLIGLAASAQPLNFTTLAGSPGQGSADGDISAARFNAPGGIATDVAGNVYVADTANHAIRKINGGLVSTLAGLPGVSGSADGNGGAARFNQPQAVAVDTNGMVYVADTGNHVIRMITPAGLVSTLAGSAGNPGSFNATGTNAQFYEPEGVAVKADGSLIYVADTWNHTIRQITAGGVVTTLAGLSGVGGSTNATGGSARFYQPQGIAVDRNGNIFVGDTANGTIRKVTAAGVVTTLAGAPGSYGSSNGVGSSAQFYQPMGVTVDTNGNVYVADNFNHTIRAITSGGTVTTLAGFAGNYGSTDGAGSARFYAPQGVAVSGDTVYVADTGNHTIRKISAGGVVTTFAGSASIGSADGSGSSAKFYWPQGAAIDNAGNIFVSDTFNHTIRKITPAGVVSTFAGSAGIVGGLDGSGGNAQFSSPQGTALDAAGNLYVADSANHAIRKIAPDGTVITLAGSVGTAGFVDGNGINAQFNGPLAVAVDNANNVYVTDTGNHTIRKITVGGTVTTLGGIAGLFGNLDSNMDNAGTNTARFNSPAGIAVDSSGNVFVSDTGNHTIRKITAGGVVNTIAGLPGVWGNADGTNRAARFFQPRGLTLDGQGNLFVMDAGNHTVRRLAPSGTNWIVSTVVGQVDVAGSSDGAAGFVQFNSPAAIDANAVGIFVVADSANGTIRIGQPPVARFEAINFFANGTVQLNMSGTPGTNYTLLATTNFIDWDSVTVLLSGNGSFQYVDSSVTNYGERFYRLQLGP